MLPLNSDFATSKCHPLSAKRTGHPAGIVEWGSLLPMGFQVELSDLLPKPKPAGQLKGKGAAAATKGLGGADAGVTSPSAAAEPGEAKSPRTGRKRASPVK